MTRLSNLLQKLGFGLRALLAVAAVAAIGWAFVRVALRPLRDVQARGDKIELTVMHWSGGGPQEETIVKNFIRAFEEKHPGVRVRRVNPGDSATFYTKLQTMMAGGVAPDVFYIGSERLAGFVAEDQLLEIEPLIAADRAAGTPTINLDDFYKGPVDTFRFDGRTTGSGTLFGVPKDFTPVGFYYNKDLFKRAGVPEPPDDWSWDDFLVAARAIGKLDGCIGAHFASWPSSIRIYLWTEGVDVLNEDATQAVIDDPRIAAALERLCSWRFDETRTLTPGDMQITIEDSILLAGNIGMAGPFGRWVTPTLRKTDRFDWDFAPLPHGAERVNAVYTVAWAISRHTKHPAESWELVKHMTGRAGQEATARSGLAMPTMRSVAESAAFDDPTLKPERDSSFLKAAEIARAIRWPPTQKVEARLQARMGEAFKSGTKTVPEALAAFKRDFDFIVESPLARGDYPRVPWAGIVGGAAAAVLVGGLLGVRSLRRSRPGRLARREERSGYALASPYIIGLVVFTAFPIGLSLLLAFSKWSGVRTLDSAQWVGLGNMTHLVVYDEVFRQSLWVTVFYALVAVPLTQIVALFAAALMSRDIRGVGLYRSAWYLPSVLAGVAVAILFRWVFDGNGLLNAALRPIAALVGAEPPKWLGADAQAWGPPAFALMALWTIGGSMMIYLAGLKNIPQELYEAAAIDGARRLGRLWNVTLPMLSPVVFFNVIMAVIGSFQVFVQSFVMTSGGPGDATRFYVLYLYNKAFDYLEMGSASAMAWVLFVIVLALTLVMIRASRRYVHYEGLKA